MLPVLPRLPEQVDPDSWLNAIDGKLYQRRVEANGAVKVDKFRYYVQQKLRGQHVLLKVNTAQQTFEIFFQGRRIK